MNAVTSPGFYNIDDSIHDLLKVARENGALTEQLTAKFMKHKNQHNFHHVAFSSEIKHNKILFFSNDIVTMKIVLLLTILKGIRLSEGIGIPNHKLASRCKIKYQKEKEDIACIRIKTCAQFLMSEENVIDGVFDEIVEQVKRDIADFVDHKGSVALFYKNLKAEKFRLPHGITNEMKIKLEEKLS